MNRTDWSKEINKKYIKKTLDKEACQDYECEKNVSIIPSQFVFKKI